LVQPFSVSAYNKATSIQLPTLGAQAPYGILVGNTRRFWPPFVQDLQRRRKQAHDLAELRNPINHYTQRCISQVCTEVLGDADVIPYRVLYSHDQPVSVHMQQAGHTAGLAYKCDRCYLNVHPGA
jgi:hypothetical protein